MFLIFHNSQSPSPLKLPSLCRLISSRGFLPILLLSCGNILPACELTRATPPRSDFLPLLPLRFPLPLLLPPYSFRSPTHQSASWIGIWRAPLPRRGRSLRSTSACTLWRMVRKCRQQRESSRVIMKKKNCPFFPFSFRSLTAFCVARGPSAGPDDPSG